MLLFFFPDQSNRASIGSDKMRMIVKKLCSRDPHQFFQRLETLARLEIDMNVNMHVHLIR